MAILLFLAMSLSMPGQAGAQNGDIERPDAWATARGGASLPGYTVSAGANRLLVFVTGFENNGDNPITEVTFGGGRNALGGTEQTTRGLP